MQENAINLLGLTREKMADLLKELGEKPFRAQQVMKWLHHFQADDVEQMSNISKVLRAQLQEKCSIALPEIAYDNTASDGTRKWLFRLDTGNSVETVFIPDVEKSRGTLCISSQVGCALDCTFCSTGRQGFTRNLSTAEIIAQVFWASKLLKQGGQYGDRPVTNVVFMGMGEPLLNYTAVVDAARILMDDWGYGLSKRRVTISTSGVVPALLKLPHDVDLSLAISLHAPNDTLRDEIVPINKKYPLKELLAACQHFTDVSSANHVMYEYVMIREVNDTPEHARQLLELLKGMPAKINLIPFNPFPQSGYKRSSYYAVEKFQKILIEGGIVTTLRKTRGDDIDAACGQLVGQVDQENKDRRQKRLKRIGVIRAA